MNFSWITCSGAAAAIAAFIIANPARAAMAPAMQYGHPTLQRVDCAVGFHIGPAGACIIGVEELHDQDVIIEHRGASEGCETKSVTRSDDMGNSETRTRTDCD